MLIAYVSDERFVAVADALLTFHGEQGTWNLRSGADGSVAGELPPGRYAVTVARDGFGSKRSVVELAPEGVAGLGLAARPPRARIPPRATRSP